MENNSLNTKIWKTVCETNPAYTKTTDGKGFKCTSIASIYQIERCTAMWGPIGIGWGFSITKDEIKKGALIVIDGGNHDYELVHEMEIALWYMHEGIKSEPIIGRGATFFVQKTKYGMKTDDEAAKKTLTDAFTNALKYLGFSADVHMGLFDDSKYVNNLKTKYSAEESKKSEPKIDTHKQVEKMKSLFSSLKELDEGFVPKFIEWMGTKKAYEYKDLSIKDLMEGNALLEKKLAILSASTVTQNAEMGV